MKKIISVLLIMVLVFANTTVSLANVESDIFMEENYMEYIISHTKVDPLLELEVNGVIADFEYSNGLRTRMETQGSTRLFEYVNGRLYRQIDDVAITFLYDVDECVGIEYRDSEYSYIFDDWGSVIALMDENRTTICEYQYEGAVAIVNCFAENADSIYVSYANPIRYKGWYFDVETEVYYMGEGIYYDPLNKQYIHNPYYFDSRSEEPLIVRTVAEAYCAMMGLSTYGAGSYAFPSQSDWNNGVRWYTGISQIELMARCVFAENNGINRSNDRKAIGLVIRNRVAHGFPHPGLLTPYNMILYPAAFATINPSSSYSNMVSSTGIARGVMSKTNTAFQQATYIACTLHHTTSYSDYSLVVGIPSYMNSDHTHFLAVNYVYANSVFSVTTTGGVIQWKKGSTNIYDVCISGTALLTSMNGSGSQCLQTYYLDGYNVFFRY